jgi:hypothetical protein
VSHSLSSSGHHESKTVQDLLEESGADFIKKEDGFEDIKHSSTLFNKVRIAEFITLYFSLSAVGLSIIAYEKDYYNLLQGLPDEHPDCISVMVLMWIAFLENLLLFTSIVLRHFIYFKWLHSKKLVTQYDTLRNTGQWKIIVKELLVCIIMPLPFINNLTYSEVWKDSDPVYFKWNYILLACMTFTRLY